MSLSIITAAYLRKDIFELFCLSMDRLRKDSGININVVCCGQLMHERLCKKHDIEFLLEPCNRLGWKFQGAISTAQKYNDDAVMILGSDDIIDINTLKELHSAATEENDIVAGINDLYFFSVTHGTASQLLYYHQPHMLGPCRTISRSVLDNLKWVLWNGNTRSGLDYMASEAINKVRHKDVVIPGLMCVDVKSRTNLNSFDFWSRKELDQVDNQKFYDILSDKELTLLHKIIKQNSRL
jgi:hypothetical protein